MPRFLFSSSARDDRHSAFAHLLTGMALFGLLGTGACNRKATREECDKMLDRYVEMTLDPSDTEKLTPVQAQAIFEMKKAIRKSEPQFSKVVQRCEHEISHRTVNCAMKAGNANEWEACVQD